MGNGTTPVKGDRIMKTAWDLLEDAFRLDLKALPHTWRSGATEVRIGAQRAIRVRMGIQECFLRADGSLSVHEREGIRPDKKWLESGLDRIANYSLYAYEEQLSHGFLTVQGGHRIGVAGRAVLEHGRIRTLSDISAMIMRMAHEVKGCSDLVFPYIKKGTTIRHTLIVSPPGAGKTTLLRDLLRRCSDELMLQVGIADERSELAACRQGIPQMDVGIRTEVLDGAPKAEGIRMLLRSVSPQVIGADEIGTQEETMALAELMRCGVKVLCTVHAGSLEELRSRRDTAGLLEHNIPERIIVLADQPGCGNVAAIWDQEGNRLYDGLETAGRCTARTGGLDDRKPGFRTV